MQSERSHNIASMMAVLVAVAALIGWSLWSSRQPIPEDPRIVSVAVSQSGSWLAAGTADDWIALWKLCSTERPVHLGNANGALNDLQFSPDENWLAVADKCLRLEPMDRTKHASLLRGDNENYGTARFSPAGDTVLTITGRGLIEILNAKTGKATTSVCCSSVAGAVAFSPDGSVFLNAGHVPTVWETHSGSLVARLTRERQFMALIPIAFLGHNVLMGSQDGGIRVWDLRTYQSAGASPRSADWVDTIAVQDRTGLVAYAGFGKILRVWNPKTAVRYSVASICPTSNIVFLSPGGPLVAGLADGTIVFCDIRNGERQNVLHFPRDN